MAPNPLLVHAALLLVSVIFGVNYVTMKIVLESVPVGAWVFYRIAAAAVLLAPVLWIRRRALPPARTWPWLAVAALLGVVLNQTLFAQGLERTTSAHSALINTSIPVLTLCFAVLARQERFSIPKLCAIAVALTGVLSLLRIDKWLDGSVVLQGTLVGDLFTLGNAMSFSAFLVVMRRVGANIEPLLATALCFALATAMVGPLQHDTIGVASLQRVLAPAVLPLALYSIIVATVLSYLLNNWALRHAHSSQVALYIYAQPIVATSLSIALGREHPDLRFWLAAVLVLSGILIETLGQQARLRRATRAAR